MGKRKIWKRKWGKNVSYIPFIQTIPSLSFSIYLCVLCTQ